MPVFTPDNEPYLGRQSVLQFDKIIVVAMRRNQEIAPWTHGKELTSLQRAGTELIPHGFSIALSIRELIRQGYLISAEILLRPLIERAAVLSYLCETPSALPLWEADWPHKSRPPLFKMLAAMRGADNAVPQGVVETARDIIKYFNALVHADPLGARAQSLKLGQDERGYSASKILNCPDKCDEICLQAMSYMLVLIGRANQIYPETVAVKH